MSASTQDAGFDVAAYVRDPIDVRPADLAIEATAGLGPATCDALRHVWAVERGVLDLLRDLLVTPTHAESRVTAFLNTWAYEQFWVAQTVAAVLEANDAPPHESPDTPLGAVRRVWDERFAPTLTAFRSNVLGEDVVAAHMVLGWLSTALMDVCYDRLAAREPRLREPAAAVRPVKARHLAFYDDDARDRLRRSPQARRLARTAVRRWEWPEVRYAGRGVVRSAVVLLFGDRAAAPGLRAVDAGVADMPGLAGLAPVRAALGRFVR